MAIAAVALARQSDETPARVPQSLSSSQPSGAEAAAPRFELVTTRAGFDALEEDWNALFERAGRGTQIFQTFNWLWHWANHFLPEAGSPGPELALVTARRGGRLVLVLPLVSERVGPIRTLSWMGEPVSQYGDVLVEDCAGKALLVADAWRFAASRTRASVASLRKVRADSEIAPALAAAGARVVAELKAPYLDLLSAPSFDEYEKRYSSGARRNRKRQRRRLEERGATVLEWHTGGARAVALTEIAFKLKLIWLRARGLVSPALADPRTERFFAAVAEAETRPAGCHVLALTCGGQPAALEIGLSCKGRSAIHIITYDLDYEKAAAGSLLMEDSIRRAKNDGMAVFDLLAPGDGYKLEWADDAVVVRDWAAPLTLAGRAYATVYLGLVRTAVKRTLDALPVGLRRALSDRLAALRSKGHADGT
jgi:CelD/BcsL family acetyltransferase involved in cellulose biosynthesis